MDSGPKPPALGGIEARLFVGDAALLLLLPPLPLNHLLQQLQCLLPLLLLELPQQLLGGHLILVAHPHHQLQDAEGDQQVGNSQSHGLEEEAEEGLSGAGWEGDGGGSCRVLGMAREGLRELGGSKGKSWGRC